ncbi:MAG: hypothetical protein JO172_15515, partial [Hyphomicrobiales bacterium]|nr:hypothetical protein [Hyphomicrobiales bacterium]
TFPVAAVPIDREALVAEAGLDYAVTSAVKVGIFYSGLYGQRAFDNAVKGQIYVRF